MGRHLWKQARTWVDAINGELKAGGGSLTVLHVGTPGNSRRDAYRSIVCRPAGSGVLSGEYRPHAMLMRARTEIRAAFGGQLDPLAWLMERCDDLADLRNSDAKYRNGLELFGIAEDQVRAAREFTAGDNLRQIDAWADAADRPELKIVVAPFWFSVRAACRRRATSRTVRVDIPRNLLTP
jgi:hypothetical protein